jgi:hypothetical protein
VSKIGSHDPIEGNLRQKYRALEGPGMSKKRWEIKRVQRSEGRAQKFRGFERGWKIDNLNEG